jgi:adenylate cyclase
MSPRLRFVLAACAGLLFAAILLFVGVSGGIDRTLYDAAARWSADFDRGKGSSSESPVELIYIDQYSLGWVEKNLGIAWPWPRELYGIMASFGSRAKAQAFDILFSEASSFGADDDARCAAAMDAAGNVALAEAIDARSGARLAPLRASKVAYGRVNGVADADGVLRRYEAGGEGGAASLGRAALAVGGDMPAAMPSGSVYLRFSGPSPSFPARNAAEILASAMSLREGKAPQVDPGVYAGKYLLIGFSAPGLLDRQAVPTDRAMPGAEIHATFIDNVLSSRLLRPLPAGFESILLLIFAFCAAWVSSYAKKPLILTAGAACFALLPAASGFILYRAGYVASAGLEMSAGLASYTAGIILSYVSEGRNKAFLRRSFSQYLAPSVIDELMRNPGLLQLGGQERVITVFFSDIQGFTSLSESMDPPRLATFMNRYLSLMTAEILREGGTVDKYVGDAVVAFWNAPLAQDDHAARAVRAAISCQKALATSEEAFASIGTPVPVTRIGLHTGKAIVGNMGSPSRFNYTALGDVVNTASRLENANKATGTTILVSGDTVAACESGKSGGLEFTRLGEISVYGKKTPIEVWEPRLSGEAASGASDWSGIKDCSSI